MNLERGSLPAPAVVGLLTVSETKLLKHAVNVLLDSTLRLLDFGSVGRLDSELRSQIGEVLLAFYRRDARAFTDALIGFVELPDEIDETALRRQIGVFVAAKLGPGSAIDVTVFTEIVRMLTQNRIAVPSELASAFRAVATLEGTLRHLSPNFDLITQARDYALSLNIRLFADKRDRTLVEGLVNTIAATVLAAAFGIMASMLLISVGGPQVTPTLTLFQIFGYLLVVLSGLLTLRVLFDVFRIRQRG